MEFTPESLEAARAAEDAAEVTLAAEPTMPNLFAAQAARATAESIEAGFHRTTIGLTP